MKTIPNIATRMTIIDGTKNAPMNRVLADILELTPVKTMKEVREMEKLINVVKGSADDVIQLEDAEFEKLVKHVEEWAAVSNPGLGTPAGLVLSTLAAIQ